MNESYETAKKLADEMMQRALAESWAPSETVSATTVPAWVNTDAARMNELAPDACLVCVMRLTHIAGRQSPGKDALQKLNYALAKCTDFMTAMKKLHEMKAEKVNNGAWWKELQEAAVS